MLAGKVERLDAIARANGMVAVGFQQIVEELHIELVVLHDEDGLGHPKPSCVSERPASPATPASIAPSMRALNTFKLVPICYGKANGTQ